MIQEYLKENELCVIFMCILMERFLFCVSVCVCVLCALKGSRAQNLEENNIIYRLNWIKHCDRDLRSDCRFALCWDMKGFVEQT